MKKFTAMILAVWLLFVFVSMLAFTTLALAGCWQMLWQDYQEHKGKVTHHGHR